MNYNRIKAIIIQEFYITKHSLENLLDVFVFSILGVAAYGLFSVFISNATHSNAGKYLLVGMLLWEILRITQMTISAVSLWNIWSRNLSNIFIAPITLSEYLLAQIISSIIKGAIGFTIVSLFSILVFNFNIYNLGFANLLLFFINLSLFACSIGISVLSIVFRFGQRLQALTWNLIFFVQPLSAAFFPVSVLPLPLQKFAYLFPSTYVFEAARFNLTNTTTQWHMMFLAFAENIIYFILSIWLFYSMFRKSKENGQFAKNEG